MHTSLLWMATHPKVYGQHKLDLMDLNRKKEEDMNLGGYGRSGSEGVEVGQSNYNV